MSADEREVRVEDRPERGRYELLVDGAIAGIATYRDAPGRRIFLHTEVDAALEGQGMGRRLAAHALDDVRSRGLNVTPRCPFIAAYIRRHPEYADLVAPDPPPQP
jgi:predicted GNAT family acetyltransferase